MPDYNRRFDPPAPTLEISVESPSSSDIRKNVTAVLDTGADITAIPRTLAKELRLEATGTMEMTGIEAHSGFHPTFIVTLRVEGFLIERIEVIEWQGDEVILGRDAMSHFEIFLDGKNRKFEIRDP